MSSKTTMRDASLIQRAFKTIPSPTAVLATGLKNAGANLKEPKWVRRHFSEAVITLEESAYNAYLDCDSRAFEKLIDEWVNAHGPELGTLRQRYLNGQLTEFLAVAMKRFAPIAVQWEFQSAQMRKARGGRTYEMVLENLLHMIGIPCEKPSGKAKNTLKRIDLVVPDQQTAMSKPDHAFFVSCKRTLRERWKQTIPERQPSWRVYLVTSDDTLTENTAREINKLGMIVYVRDILKSEPHLATKSWVRPLSSLPKDLKR